MNENYRSGYRDGFSDGYKEAQKQLRGSPTTLTQYPPNTNSYPLTTDYYPQGIGTQTITFTGKDIYYNK